MSNHLNALKNAAREHIENRMESSRVSQQAFQAWREQLRNLMNGIASWVHPLHELDNFSVKETEFSYSSTDANGRKAEQKGPGLKLTFADTELLIGPSYINIGWAPGVPMLCSGAVTVVGLGMKDTCQLHYFNGTFNTFTYGDKDGPIGDISFTNLLASIVPELKASAT